MRRGVSEEALMEEAGQGLARVLRATFPQPGAAVIFAGKGHNAGDALVLAGHLAAAGWTVEVRLVWPGDSLRPLAAKKLKVLGGRVEFAELESEAVPAGRPLVLVDGLLGIGAAGMLRGRAREAVNRMNALRDREQAFTVAVDLPSGLGGDEDPVVADLTVSLGYPKEVLFGDEAAAFAGRLECVPLEALDPPDTREGRDVLVTREGLRAQLPCRPRFSRHKGEAGRIGILAGSRGLTGAARLASTAAALMGGGLVTLFCAEEIYEMLAAACPPEVMVRPVRSCQEIRDFRLDALGVGPGLGPEGLSGLAELLREDPRPVVVDADALTALAALDDWQDGSLQFAGPRLLTPHPGELSALVRAWRPELAGSPRLEQAQALAGNFGVTVLAKSARSLVTGPEGPAAWNGTGHPLMARGGMGDVLTGFLTTFAAQGMELFEAAALGSWVLGRGAEIYRSETGWEEPGLATEVMRRAAGPAMAELREPGAVRI